MGDTIRVVVPAMPEHGWSAASWSDPDVGRKLSGFDSSWVDMHDQGSAMILAEDFVGGQFKRAQDGTYYYFSEDGGVVVGDRKDRKVAVYDPVEFVGGVLYAILSYKEVENNKNVPGSGARPEEKPETKAVSDRLISFTVFQIGRAVAEARAAETREREHRNAERNALQRQQQQPLLSRLRRKK